MSGKDCGVGYPNGADAGLVAGVFFACEEAIVEGAGADAGALIGVTLLKAPAEGADIFAAASCFSETNFSSDSPTKMMAPN